MTYTIRNVSRAIVTTAVLTAGLWFVYHNWWREREVSGYWVGAVDSISVKAFLREQSHAIEGFGYVKYRNQNQKAEFAGHHYGRSVGLRVVSDSFNAVLVLRRAGRRTLRGFGSTTGMDSAAVDLGRR